MADRPKERIPAVRVSSVAVVTKDLVATDEQLPSGANLSIRPRLRMVDRLLVLLILCNAVGQESAALPVAAMTD
jgi:hypothetical protein